MPLKSDANPFQATSGPHPMRKPSAGKPASCPGYLIQKADPVILHADFDAIPEAEDELRREVMAGHLFAGDPFTGKPRS